MNINKEILRLAVPNIISNISIPLLSTVDTALMGHLSADHLGAVGIGSMIFNFIYWNFGFLRMGTTGITAQAYGADNSEGVNLIFYRAMGIALFISVLLLIFNAPICQLSLKLMNVIPDQVPLVSEYFNIRILAAPATISLYVLMGWYFGMQNSVYPLVVTVLVNVLNLVLSYVLVRQYGLGIAGVAYGTVVAQYFGVLVAILILAFRYRNILYLRFGKVFSNVDDWLSIFRINLNLFIRTVCLTFVFGFFYSKSSASGVLVLASNTILLQFLNWMSYGIDGFAFASESLVGKYYGAKSYLGLKKAIYLSFIWGCALAIAYALLFYAFGELIVRIFTQDQQVFAFTMERVWWIVILPIISFASYIWDGVYIGLTAARQMRDTMIIAVCVYLGTYFALHLFNKEAIWIALSVFLFFRGLIQTIYWMVDKELRTIKASITKAFIH